MHDQHILEDVLLQGCLRAAAGCLDGSAVDAPYAFRYAAKHAAAAIPCDAAAGCLDKENSDDRVDLPVG